MELLYWGIETGCRLLTVWLVSPNSPPPPPLTFHVMQYVLRVKGVITISTAHFGVVRIGRWRL
jgi:hypothetical protein